MIKVLIILYITALGIFFLYPGGFSSSEWLKKVYHVWDHIAGCGCLGWLVLCKKSVKYKSACFATFLFSLLRLAWLLVFIYYGKSPENTEWTTILFIALIPVAFYTLFVPDGRLTIFLDKYLKYARL